MEIFNLQVPVSIEGFVLSFDFKVYNIYAGEEFWLIIKLRVCVIIKICCGRSSEI